MVITIKFDLIDNIAYISNNTYSTEANIDNIKYDFNSVFTVLYVLSDYFGFDLSLICNDNDSEAVKFKDFVTYVNKRIEKSDEADNIYYINN